MNVLFEIIDLRRTFNDIEFILQSIVRFPRLSLAWIMFNLFHYDPNVITLAPSIFMVGSYSFYKLKSFFVMNFFL